MKNRASWCQCQRYRGAVVGMAQVVHAAVKVCFQFVTKSRQAVVVANVDRQ